MNPEPLPIEMCLRAWEPPPSRRAAPSQAEASPAEPPEHGPWRFETVKLLITIDTETSTEGTCALPGFEREKWGRGAQRLLFGRMSVYRVGNRAGEASVTHVVELICHACS